MLKTKQPKILCKEDGLTMIPVYNTSHGENYLCSSNGVFAMHFRKRLVSVESLPQRTKNKIFNPKPWPLNKKTIKI